MIKTSILDAVLKKVLNLQPEEKFLVVTDPLKESLARQFYTHAQTITTKAKIIVMPVLKQSGEEPPQEVAEEMKQNDVQILLTAKSISHTKARRDAIAKGARLISSPGMTAEMLNRCVDIDYDELISFHEWLRPIIINSNEIRVTSKNGTDITFAVRNTHGKSSELLKDRQGKSGNLPTGEIDSGVISEKTNGRIVIDGSMLTGLLKEPIVLEVKKGAAQIVSDNPESEELKEVLDNVGPEAYKIAEFGVGTNPKAIITGEVLEDEKVRGTVHFAVGNDLTYGGNNDVPIHLDGVLRKPTMIIDGKVVIEDGEFRD